MTAISKCHVNYVHFVMLIMYTIPSAVWHRLKSMNAPVMVNSVLRGDSPT